MQALLSHLHRHKKLVALLVIFGCLIVTGGHVEKSQSANLTSASVTMSNSRLSFSGALAAGNTVGGSSATITTSSWASISTAQLVYGESVLIGEAGSLGSYTVTEVVDADTFSVTPVLASGDADSGDHVIATSSGNLRVRFTTANAIPNGRFRILVPALADNTNAADGLPDQSYFDFGSSAPTVTCPDDISGYDFVAGTASASAITISGTDYHAYECAYSGNGAIGTAFDGTTNDYIEISNIINPAPASGHTTGTADSYNIVIHQINSSFAVADSVTTAVGVIEAVRVTATVAPQISFTIAGVSSSTSTCGISTGVTTTASTVPLGELSIGSFTHAAQTLTVSTNATNGYAVTAIENDQLGLDGGTCTGDNTGADCIRDAAGDNAAMSHTASDEWALTATKGFGYTIHNSDAASVAFEYTTATGNCAGAYCARQFADAEDSQTPVTLFSSSTVADSQNVNVCYKAVISSTQSAGAYDNYITYTATATF